MKITIKDFNDIRLINYYTGYIILVVAGLMLIPIITSVSFKEWNTVLDFGISINISIIIGLVLMITGNNKAKKFEWKHVVQSFQLVGNTLVMQLEFYNVLNAFLRRFLETN